MNFLTRNYYDVNSTQSTSCGMKSFYRPHRHGLWSLHHSCNLQKSSITSFSPISMLMCLKHEINCGSQWQKIVNSHMHLLWRLTSLILKQMIMRSSFISQRLMYQTQLFRLIIHWYVCPIWSLGIFILLVGQLHCIHLSMNSLQELRQVRRWIWKLLYITSKLVMHHWDPQSLKTLQG